MFYIYDLKVYNFNIKMYSRIFVLCYKYIKMLITSLGRFYCSFA